MERTLTTAIFLLTVLSSLPRSTEPISVRPWEFAAKGLHECYKLDMRGNPYVLGQQNPAGPTGNSMENLISIVEKIEDYIGRNQHRPDILARMILSRFHIDEYNYYPMSNVFTQDVYAKRRNKITEILVDAADTTLPPFPEDALTSDEKCSMYFMLSHNINHTALPTDRRVYMASVRQPYPNGGSTVAATATNNRQGTNSRISTTFARTTQVRLTEEAREQGVVGFRNHPVHSIAPARVLLGIVAANTRSQEMSTQDILRLVTPLNSRQPDGFKDSILNVPLIVTLGEVWAHGAIPSLSLQIPTKEFGAKGQWNSTLCQITYTLDTNDTRGSLAEIRGAIDGYLLGKKSSDILRDTTNFRLSSLMRQYYSPTGLFDEFTSVCNRERISVETSNLKDQVKAYMSLYLPMNGIFLTDNQVNEIVDSSARYFETALREAQSSIPEDREWCRPTRIEAGINSAICKTPEDVIVVVDLDGDFDQQAEIVKRLSNELDMRNYGSSMTVVANTRGGGYDYSSDGLSRIAWNTSNRACSNCRLAWIDRQNFGYGFRNTPDMFFRALNSTLRDLKVGGTIGQGTKDELAAPGKPIIFFNYGSLRRPTTGDRRPFDAAQWDLMRDHRDVPLLVVGNQADIETLKLFAYDDSSDVFKLDPDVTGVTEKLLRRICDTPAAIQHPRCRMETSNSLSFTGFVSRGKKQYWAMFPEYFIKSYNIIFEITAVSGPIKVCYRRGYPKPEEDERNCEKLDPSGKPTHVMRSANPCHKFDLSNCPPYYFTIIGLNEGTTASTKCKKEGCLNMDQIEWTFTHTGVSCSSATTTVASIAFTLVATLFAIKNFPMK